MRLSRYFLPVLKENPAEAQIVSHRYMLRAGMIKQQAAGIYSWLPLGYRVLKRIEQIVHEEQVRAGHIPLLMPTLQPADLWRESGRYDDYGQEMLRIKDRHERDMLYGPPNMTACWLLRRLACGLTGRAPACTLCRVTASRWCCSSSVSNPTRTTSSCTVSAFNASAKAWRQNRPCRLFVTLLLIHPCWRFMRLLTGR